MDSVIRAAVMYLALLVVFRLSGRRTLQQMTSFDLILLLVISETTQDAMVGDDPSFTNALLLVTTFVAMDVAFSFLKRWSARADRLIEGLPTLLVFEGRTLDDRLRAARVDAADVLAAARQAHGIVEMDEIRMAVLETGGRISIVPKPSSPPARG